jgi:ankyrin repeat protein
MGPDRATPLLAASVYSDSPASVELLVRHGADTKSTCDFGANVPRVPPFVLMAWAQSNDCIRRWADQRFEGFDIHEEAGHGFSALFLAAMMGGGNSIETVKLLCDLGADYTKQSSAGQQFTTTTSFSGDSEVIQYVISKGEGAMIDGLSTPNVTKNAFLRRIIWIFRMLYVSYVHA